MDVGSIVRIFLILGTATFLTGCEYGPFQTQTQSLPGAVAVHLDDPFYLSGDNKKNQWYLETINAPEAWAQYAAIAADPVGGIAVRTIPVAVIDSGIDGTHEDLKGVLGRTGADLVGGTVTPIPQGFPADAYGIEHGTHVAGLVAAEGGNGRGILGVAYNGWDRPAVSVVPVRALNGLNGSLGDVIRGVLFAAGAARGQQTAPARVINMSLGADEIEDESSILLFESAMEAAQRRGLLLVAAAGNGIDPDGPRGPLAAQGRSDGIDWPARFPSVIAVGSVDRAANPEDSQRSYFSDYGLQLELMAPGAEATGGNQSDTAGIISTVPSDSRPLYGIEAGTSMAAPLVAGAAALVWSANPHLSADQVRRVLQQAALDLGEPGRDEEFGYGLIDVGEALRVASTTPYGRYESSSVAGASDVEEPVSTRQLVRSKRNVEYDPQLPAEILVYLSKEADVENFAGRVLAAESGAEIETLGYLPLGTALQVSVGGSPTVPGEAEELFNMLRDDPDVLSIVQNRVIQFGRH